MDNLKAEMQRNGLTVRDIMATIGCSEKTARNKINGETDSLIRPAGEERMSRRKWSLLIGLIGSVVFNVGWWISYPPMVFAGVLLAAAGLDLWIERSERRTPSVIAGAMPPPSGRKALA